MIKTVKLYINSSKNKAQLVSEKVKQALIDDGYLIVESDADLVIGFGGDGTLLKWISENNYNTNAKYIGINCGTLGFMQDFDIIDAKKFVDNIPNYMEKQLRYVEMKLDVENKKYTFYAVNEFNILNNEDKTFRSNVNILDEFLETYVGTGLIFATPTGSTARNISSVGSIMFPEIEAMQMTPIEAIVNSKIHCMPKSICIPKGTEVLLTPSGEKAIKIMADGICVYTGEFNQMVVSFSEKHMTVLTDKKNSFVRKIREKLI